LNIAPGKNRTGIVNIQSEAIPENTINLGSATSTINILGNLSATTILPKLSTYSSSTGTNVVGSVGYIYQTPSAISGTLPTGTNSIVASIPSMPIGIYMVSISFSIGADNDGEVNMPSYFAGLSGLTNISPFIAINGATNIVIPANSQIPISLCGIWSNTTVQTLRANIQPVYTTGTLIFKGDSDFLKMTAVRIA